MSRGQSELRSRVVVIGLGRFGQNVARTLFELGYEVIAIDLVEQEVDRAVEFTALAVQGDGSDEELLRSLEIQRCTVGIVAHGKNVEANLLSTLQLKRIGVPFVTARATSELHRELLNRIGADRVIFPERDEGMRLAHSLAVPSLNDYISLSPTSGIGKFQVPQAFAGHTLVEIRGEGESRISVLMIRRAGMIIASPAYSEKVQAGDELVIAGPDTEIEAFVEAEFDVPAS